MPTVGCYLRCATRPPTGRLLRSCTSLAPAAGSSFEVHPSPPKVGASARATRRRGRVGVGSWARCSLSLSLSLAGRGRVGDCARAMSAAQSAAHSIKWAPSDRAIGRRVRTRARASAVANADAPPGECGRSAPRPPRGRAQSRIKSGPTFVLSENEIKIKINSNKNAVCVKCARSVSRSQHTLPRPAAGDSPLWLAGRATRSPD